MVATVRMIRSKASGVKKISNYYTKGETSLTYYSEHGRVEGEWLGLGARQLGLEGKTVEAADFHNVLLGRDTTGRELRAPSTRKVKTKEGKNRPPDRPRDTTHVEEKDPVRVRGVDLTFSAPKSVSILHALCQLHEPDLAIEIERAFADSVKDTLKFLERNINTSRRGKGGSIETAGDLVTAIFQHELPRNHVQPQLHIHSIVASTVRRDDGAWGALHSKELFRAARSLGPYQACQFAKYLKERLGLSMVIPIDPITEKPSTTFEIAGFLRELIEKYSSRRQEILETIEIDGGKSSSAQARAAANLKTRRPKGDEITKESILEAWKELSRESGIDKESLLSMFKPQEKTRSLSNKEIEQCIISVADELVKGNALITSLDLLRHTCERLQGRASGEKIQETIEECLRGSHFVHVKDRANGDLFTTKKHWDVEKELIKNMESVSKTCSIGADKIEVEFALAKRTYLSEEQKKAVEYCCSKDSGGVRTVLGSAGSGKTTMLQTVAEAFHASGKKVVGTALAGTATQELSSVGIDSRTIASLLFEFYPEKYLSKPEQFDREIREARSNRKATIDSNTVLIIDEASMTGADEINALIKKCNELGATVILVGDLNQLTSISAACPLSFAARTFGYVAMNQNRRQLDELDRLAVDMLCHGDVEGALNQYKDRGRLTISKTRSESVDEIVKEWMKDGNSKSPDHALILTQTNYDAELINNQIQSQRLLEGSLGTSVRVARNVTLHEKDRIVFHEKVRGLIENGETGVIESIDPKKNKATVRLDHENRTLELPLKKLESAMLGYAVTTHRSQGKTVDFSYVLLGGSLTCLESVYVQLTRARHATKLFCDELHAGPGLETIINAIKRSERKQLIHELSQTDATTKNRDRSLQRERNN
jgi:conjugative relaxase-like TrwC/TraI family protein